MENLPVFVITEYQDKKALERVWQVSNLVELSGKLP